MADDPLPLENLPERSVLSGRVSLRVNGSPLGVYLGVTEVIGGGLLFEGSSAQAILRNVGVEFRDGVMVVSGTILKIAPVSLEAEPGG